MKKHEKAVLIRLVKMLKYQEYCEWMLKKDVEISHRMLYEQTGLCCYHEGVVEKAHSVVMELRLNGEIEVNVDSRELLRVNGKDVRGVEHNVILNLSDDGERWEGDVLKNQPYGWGVLYDSENRMAYEGFRLKEVNVCYGRSYYPDVGVIEYEGEICEGKRWGRGVLYDRTGKTVFDGEWVNDEQMSKIVVLNEENQLLHSCIEELIVSDYSWNGPEWRILDLSFMPHLRLLDIGIKCFINVDEVKLIGLNQLERVVVGGNSFTKYYIGARFDPSRHFYLKNCNRLRELMMDHHSFADYSVCVIENVPSLEVIEMGVLSESSHNFNYASLELKSDSDEMK